MTNIEKPQYQPKQKDVLLLIYVNKACSVKTTD